MPFKDVPTKMDFPAQERDILQFWKESNAFQKLRDIGVGDAVGLGGFHKPVHPLMRDLDVHVSSMRKGRSGFASGPAPFNVSVKRGCLVYGTTSSPLV